MNSLSTFLYFLSPISSLYLISLHTCSVQETICDAKLDLGGGELAAQNWNFSWRTTDLTKYGVLLMERWPSTVHKTLPGSDTKLSWDMVSTACGVRETEV